MEKLAAIGAQQLYKALGGAAASYPLFAKGMTPYQVPPSAAAYSYGERENSLRKGGYGLGRSLVPRISRMSSRTGRGSTITRSRRRPTTRGRRVTRKRKRYAPKSRAMRKLAKKVNRISQTINNSTYIIKSRVFHSANVSAVNQINYKISDIWDKTLLTSEFSTVPFFDIASGGTGAIVSEDLNNVSVSKRHYYSIFAKTLVRNNANMPVKVTVYCLKPKKDHNVTPTSAMVLGYPDVGLSGVVTAPMTWPTMSPDFRHLWKIVGKREMFLLPGGQFSLKKTIGRFSVNFANLVDHPDEYQNNIGTAMWMYRVEGPVVNACPGSGTMGTTLAGVNILEKRQVTLNYDGGAKMTRYKLSSNAGAITEGDGTLWLRETAAKTTYDQC